MSRRGCWSVAPPLDVALFEAVQDELSVFNKTLPPFVLVNAKAFILNAGETTAQPRIDRPPER